MHKATYRHTTLSVIYQLLLFFPLPTAGANPHVHVHTEKRWKVSVWAKREFLPLLSILCSVMKQLLQGFLASSTLGFPSHDPLTSVHEAQVENSLASR